MKNTITITSKGQTTLPAPMRRQLGLGKTGGVLHVSFDERKKELIISKPLSITEISEKLTRNIKPGTKPLASVDEYYQANRKSL